MHQLSIHMGSYIHNHISDKYNLIMTNEIMLQQLLVAMVGMISVQPQIPF